MVVLVVEEWVWTFQAGPLSHLWKHCTMLQLLSSTDENVFKKLVALIWSWLLYYFTQKVVVCLVFTKSYCREIHHSVFVFHTIFVVVSVVKSIIKSITPLHINCVWSSRWCWWGRWNLSPNPSSLHIHPAAAVIDGEDGEALVARGDGDRQDSFADEGAAAVRGVGRTL